jgi:hypothetical protein
MKNFILSTVLFLITLLNVNGQDYFSFLSGNPQWNIFLEATPCETPPDTFLLRYHFDGDITIDDTLYKKLVLEKGDTADPETTTSGGIREVGKKVYYKGEDLLGAQKYGEILLYDFSGMVGDTIIHEQHNGNIIYYSEILEIDSMKIGEQYRKRFKVHISGFYHNPDYWVEGIGSIKNGLLGHITDIPTCGVHYWEHICYQENGKQLYLNPSFSSCYPDELLSIKNIQGIENINIYPNPVSHKLHIDNIPASGELSMKIANAQGKPVLKKELCSGKNVFDFTAGRGLFIIMIISQQGQIVKSEKILKLP